MMRIYIYLIFIVSLLSATQLNSFTDDTMIQNAQNYLIDKEYTKALELYHRIESEQYYSANLYKNMAIAYAGLNNDALAILYYERALKVAPRDHDIQADLLIIRKRNPELDEGVHPFILTKMWQSFTTLLNSTIWSVLSLLFFGMAGFVLYMRLPSPGMNKKSYAYLGTALGLALLFVLASSSAYDRQYTHDKMIVTDTAVVLKTGPDVDSPDIENLPAGSKVVIKENIGEWVQVHTSLGDIGWIKADQCQKI